jgi:hypothetical protein
MSFENPGAHHNAEKILPIMERDYRARIDTLQAENAALREVLREFIGAYGSASPSPFCKCEHCEKKRSLPDRARALLEGE